MKKLYSVLFILAVFTAVTLNVYAEHPDRVVDDAELLTASEEITLRSQLDEISESLMCDVAVVTVNGTDGKSVVDFADDYYDYNGYGMGEDNDGILLLISMEERDWYITTAGYGITALTDAGINYLSEEFVPYLSDGEYYEGFSKFGTLCDKFVKKAKKGNPYDVGHMPKKAPGIKWVGISAVVGLIAALTVTGGMKSELNNVGPKATATDYVKKDSLKITDSKDILLYSHIDRVRNETESSSGGSSTHTSSSGRTHGGGGGKF